MKNTYRLILGFGIIAFTLLSLQIANAKQTTVGKPSFTDNILRSKIAFAVVGEEIARGLNLHTLSESDYYKLRGPVLLDPEADIHFQLREQYGRIANTVYFEAALDAGSPSQNSLVNPKNKPVLYQKASEIIRNFIAGRDISVIIASNAPIGIGEIAAIRRLQGEVPYTYESINSAAVSVPLKNIAALIKLPFITEIWPDSKGYLQLSHSVQHIRADKVHKRPPNGLGVTGKGVTVAVVDFGIDSNHSEFAGRIKEKRGNSGRDETHGTHIAGIIGAADNGNNITGVAPEVDFLDATAPVNILAVPDIILTARNTERMAYKEAMDAIGWAAQKHRKQRNANTKADVINMSLAWPPWIYGWDGTDLMSELIDEVVEEDGIVFVVSAGNDAKRRASGTLFANTSHVEHTFYAPPGETFDVTLVQDYGEPDLDLIILNYGDDTFCASHTGGLWSSIRNFELNPWRGTVVSETEYGHVYKKVKCNKPEISAFTVRVQRDNGNLENANQDYEIWLSEKGEFKPPSYYNPENTVMVPGYSRKAITVGNLKVRGQDLNRAEIADDSSQGSNIPNKMLKPEVVAPGVGIESTVPGGGYEPETGTSMAAPHVAGVAALILDAVGKNRAGEWNFSPAEVKSAIVRGAEVVGNLSNTPDNKSGAGLVKADNIIFGGTVDPGQQLYFKITPRLDSYSYNNLFLHADIDLAVAISWESNSSHLDLELLDKSIKPLSQSVAGIKSQKIVNSRWSSSFYLKVIHNDPKGQPISFTGASTHPIADITEVTELDLHSKNITDISILAGLTELIKLDLGDNNITDVSPLENLTKLTRLNLYNNTIADISPLVGLNLTGTQWDSTGLSLEGNPLSYAAIHTHIPAMQAKGIVVKFEDRAHPALLKVSGDAQVGAPGAVLPTPFVVEAMGASGKPMAKVPITFAITAGDGSLSTTTTTTDAEGRASTFLTFGSTTGATIIHVTAENISQPVEFTATASSRGTPVTIPDANLRAKIVETLGKSSDAMLTTEDMLTLTTLNAHNANIHVLTGLQHAHNLKTLRLGRNNIADVSPLAELTQLTSLNLSSNRSSFSVNGLTDVSPLENLTQLRTLNLGGNYITDVSPLENLPKLTNLEMWGNRITDVSHLAELTQLTHLDLSFNNITDVSPLAKLTKLTNLDLSTNGRLDVSSLAKLTQLRILDLGGNYITDLSPLASSLAKLTQLTTLYLGDNNITDLSPLENLTKLTGLMLWRNNITDVSPLEKLTQLTTLYLTSNNIADVRPLENLVGLTTLYLSSNSITDVSPLENLTQLTRLDLNNNTIADISPLVELNLIGRPWDSTGLSLEGNPLSYAAIHTHIPAMQAKGIVVKFEDRAHPALLKVSGDAQVGAPGAVLPTPFVVGAMDASGKPMANVSVAFTITAGDGQLSATTLTTDTNGKAETVLTLGPSLGKQTVTATATEIMPSGLTFTAIVTEDPERFAADVNGDGEINIQDVVLVSSSLGQTGENDADVNGDGEVNIQDLVAVTAAIGEVAAAPAAVRQKAAAHLTQEDVQHWLTQAQQANLTDATSVRGIRFLKQLLAAMIPKETALLPNYPNPFNPETWIPYQLATPADVTLTIYDIQGRVVRNLDLGHQPIGIYQIRSRAAHWDGRNAVGEPVASGVYFYTLTAGDFTATRKMLIAK